MRISDWSSDVCSSDLGGPAARGNDLLQPGERAAAHEQDIGGVDLEELLLRVLASALRGHRGDRAFHDLEQRLLHALARHVDRKSVVEGKSVSVRVDLGGRRIIKKKNKTTTKAE